MAGGDGIAGALEGVVVPGVVLAVRMWVLEWRCSADPPVGVVFMPRLPEGAVEGPRMERCVD